MGSVKDLRRVPSPALLPLKTFVLFYFIFFLFFIFQNSDVFLKCQHGWSSGEGSLSVFSADTDEIKEDESHNVKMMLSLKIK